jgi:hypothetical protein
MQIESTASDRLSLLCERLSAATLAREAQWNADGDDSFLWVHPEGGVTIESRDKDGQPPYELRIYNPDHEPVDELASDLVADEEPAPWNGALAALYRAARRSALHADDIIDALTNALPPAGSERGAPDIAS